ncbi:MAG TPA: DNA repair protein RadC [Acidiphilium sp.]|nr:DNA repair protein RadC [Acidiphilium sp.]HQU22849.1 DNA repair protein RadC [Acidiphilium sp.]
MWDRLLKTLRRAEAEPFPDAPMRRVTGMAERPAPAPVPQSADAVGFALDAAPFPSTGPQGHRARMRERLLERGAESLADYELLEMLLFLAFKKGDTKPLAKALINRFGSYAGVLAAPPDILAVEPGVGPHSVAAIKLVQASAERLARAELADLPILNNWERLIDYLTIAMAREPVEQFRILFLDNRNRLIANEIASRGTVNHTSVYVREVVKRALELHATALILVHNHPSGDPTASRDDIAMTGEIERAIRLMDIVLHDHLIIGKGRFLSFRQEGLIGRPAGRA